MSSSITLEKGGRNAAFFFFFLCVSTLGFGGSLQAPLFLLRAGAFLAAIVYLWHRRNETITATGYALLAGGFTMLTLGHAFSSVYVWVSVQHALNILAAAIFLGWAYLLFREDMDRHWRIFFHLAMGIAVTEILVSLVQRTLAGAIRPHGTFDNPNFLAEFLAVAALLCLARLLFREESGRVRLGLAAAVPLFLFAALTISGSRGVFIAVVPAVSLLLIAAYGIRKGTAFLLVGGLPLLGLLGFRAVSRFFSPDIYNYGRWIMWKSALRTFFNHPFGVGLGGYKYYWYVTQDPIETAFRKFGKFAYTAHNEYLEVLTGIGAFGLLLFVFLLIVPLVLGWRARKEILPERREMAAAAAAGLVLTGIHAGFDFNFHEFGIVYTDVTLLGVLLASLPKNSPGRTWTIPSPVFRGAIPVIAAILLVSVATFAGATAHYSGEYFLRKGDDSWATTFFRLAATADPFRAPYPDALSALEYRRFATSDQRAADVDAEGLGALDRSIWFEAKAANLSPREIKYLQRLSFLFAERFRMRGDPADMKAALFFVDKSLEVNPYSVESLWHRSGLLVFTGRRKEALTSLVRAVNLEPNFCRGYAKLAELIGSDDPVASTGWEMKEEQCRVRAKDLVLEDHERWLVEGP